MRWPPPARHARPRRNQRYFLVAESFLRAFAGKRNDGLASPAPQCAARQRLIEAAVGRRHDRWRAENFDVPLDRQDEQCRVGFVDAIATSVTMPLSGSELRQARQIRSAMPLPRRRIRACGSKMLSNFPSVASPDPSARLADRTGVRGMKMSSLPTTRANAARFTCAFFIARITRRGVYESPDGSVRPVVHNRRFARLHQRLLCFVAALAWCVADLEKPTREGFAARRSGRKGAWRRPPRPCRLRATARVQRRPTGWPLSVG